MKCPHCGSEIQDRQPSFCPRCGKPMADVAGSDATVELSGEATLVTVVDEAPTSGSEEPHAGATETQEARPPLGELVEAMPRMMRREGWVDLAAGAFFALLVAIACGAVLVLAAKLQYSFLGSDASPVSILSTIVIVGIAVTGAPIEIGGISVSAIPLGALLVVAAALVWAAARAVRNGPASGPRAAALDGAKIAVPFSLMCFLAALLARIGGETPVRVDAAAALLLGLLWGAIAGMLGGLAAIKPLRAHVRTALDLIKARARTFYEAIMSAGVMLGVSWLIGVLAGLVWIITGLIEGRPSGDFDAGEAGASVIYLIAFGPNVLASILTVAHGAPVEVGAQITSGGRALDNVQEISLFDWGSSGPPWYAFALVAIPALACGVGGWYARRNTIDRGRIVAVLVGSAVIYSAVMFEIVALAEARLGAGLVRAKGFGKVAPDPWVLLLLAAGWALLAGFVGWIFADRMRSETAAG